MKTSFLVTLVLLGGASACMSDKACQGGAVDMCCYMNKCVESSNLGCTGGRLDFYKHLITIDEKSKLEAFKKELRVNSDKVVKCDQQGIHCIDYVSELMTDPGAF